MNELENALIRDIYNGLVEGRMALEKIDVLVAWANETVSREVAAWTSSMDEGELPPSYNNPENPCYDKLTYAELLRMVGRELPEITLEKIRIAKERYTAMKAQSKEKA